ncbi:hypothetical protein [Ottowia thiooxydans]|uniref:hypothetical protein n=1 Tax=Ottowia thiooxydans TaxID=219182 RepID=UPI0033916C9E
MIDLRGGQLARRNFGILNVAVPDCIHQLLTDHLASADDPVLHTIILKKYHYGERRGSNDARHIILTWAAAEDRRPGDTCRYGNPKILGTGLAVCLHGLGKAGLRDCGVTISGLMWCTDCV